MTDKLLNSILLVRALLSMTILIVLVLYFIYKNNNKRMLSLNQHLVTGYFFQVILSISVLVIKPSGSYIFDLILQIFCLLLWGFLLKFNKRTLEEKNKKDELDNN